MAAWLVENFVWVALLIMVVAVGIKIAIGGVLNRLMDESAQREATDQERVDSQDNEEHRRQE